MTGMGNLFRRSGSIREGTATRSQSEQVLPQVDSLWWSKRTPLLSKRETYNVQTIQQFIELIRKELNKEDRRNLRTFFALVNASILDVTKYFQFFLIKGMQFNKIFHMEMGRFEKLFERSETRSNLAKSQFSQCLHDHCFGILATHLDIIENLDDEETVDAILLEIAASHMYMKNAVLLMQKLEEALHRFFVFEFHKTINKSIERALNTYFKIMDARLQVHGSCLEQNFDMELLKQAIVQRNQFIEQRIQQSNDLNVLYMNTSKGSYSSCSVPTSDQNQPSSSRTAGNRGFMVTDSTVKLAQSPEMND